MFIVFVTADFWRVKQRMATQYIFIHSQNSKIITNLQYRCSTSMEPLQQLSKSNVVVVNADPQT